ncbi:uncharacterized protein LOC127837902 isoform X2 [Dreissena polymorpha]|uniref:uncharacterized protein LOC127837902 isoform X2 n=1 Tax=Dreissena polymorpha TaxID=45954 RepID=UPI002264787B|nr:uncharacterized protein LOC127837902 isoform X2 [Dreissena polymorpha]
MIKMGAMHVYFLIVSMCASLVMDCRDTLDYCAKYDPSVCTNTTYRAYMTAKCPKYCGICTPAHPDPIVPVNCADALPNCVEYDTGDLCTRSDYHQWARENCRVYCQFDGCRQITSPPECKDRDADCVSHEKSICTTSKPWATFHCPAYCGFCQPAATTPVACTDTLTNCREYDSGNLCTDHTYAKWVLEHCKHYCRVPGCI